MLCVKCICNYLKSNMDRFIDITCTYSNTQGIDLKSNMDRFIAVG